MNNWIEIVEYYFNRNKKYSFIFDKESTLIWILNEDDLVFNRDIEKYLLNYFTGDELYNFVKWYKVNEWNEFALWVNYIDNYK